MSLIKSVDVPKHMADRLRSRRIAARLAGGAAKPTAPPAKALVDLPTAVPPAANDSPASGLLSPPVIL